MNINSDRDYIIINLREKNYLKMQNIKDKYFKQSVHNLISEIKI